MTEVAFHFNAPDKLAYVCRFARKALLHDARLVVVGPESVLVELDRMLWQMAPHDFVAHCRETAAPELRAASPILLTVDARESAHHDVLLNLTSAVPDGFERYQRLVEVVSEHDEQDRSLARQRWRHYAGRGYAITRHDLVLKAAA